MKKLNYKQITTIHRLKQAGFGNVQISKMTGHCPNVIRKYADEYKPCDNSFIQFLSYFNTIKVFE